MTNIVFKTLIATSFFALAAGTADARNFFSQAATDIGNGAKTIAKVIAPSKPGPGEPNRGPSQPMGPCTLSPGSCQAPPQ